MAGCRSCGVATDCTGVRLVCVSDAPSDVQQVAVANTRTSPSPLAPEALPQVPRLGVENVTLVPFRRSGERFVRDFGCYQVSVIHIFFANLRNTSW